MENIPPIHGDLVLFLFYPHYIGYGCSQHSKHIMTSNQQSHKYILIYIYIIYTIFQYINIYVCMYIQPLGLKFASIPLVAELYRIFPQPTRSSSKFCKTCSRDPLVSLWAGGWLIWAFLAVWPRQTMALWQQNFPWIAWIFHQLHVLAFTIGNWPKM